MLSIKQPNKTYANGVTLQDPDSGTLQFDALVALVKSA